MNENAVKDGVQKPFVAVPTHKQGPCELQEDGVDEDPQDASNPVTKQYGEDDTANGQFNKVAYMFGPASQPLLPPTQKQFGLDWHAL